MRTLFLTLITCLFVLPAYAKYNGGSGVPNDPYQIATAEDLITLGETPEDYDKHFILTADIDLDPNLPGRRVFDKALIAPATWVTGIGVQGIPFTGVFDGEDHNISRLTIAGEIYVGLFGQLGEEGTFAGEVKNLSMVDINITGSSNYVGGLIGVNCGTVGKCHSSGMVNGNWDVGGLIGSNCGSIDTSHSMSTVNGHSYVGGLVGSNSGTITQCYSIGSFTVGSEDVGGLVGLNHGHGSVTDCHSMGVVSGGSSVGGLAGSNCGEVANCYSTSTVIGDGHAGGLIGSNQEFYIMDKGWAGWAPVGGLVTLCYSTGAVSGKWNVGGLVGVSCGQINNCYSTSVVTGGTFAGGLVGANYVSWNNYGSGASIDGIVAQCYGTGAVNGNSYVGGLVGDKGGDGWQHGSISSSFWDIETSGCASSSGGTGKTTAEMHDIHTYQDAGWDFYEERQDGLHEIWHMSAEEGYPLLSIFNGYTLPELEGMGTAEEPYLISDVNELGAIVHYSLYAHYRLTDSIDLSGIRWGTSVIPLFAGTFDGNGHTISYLTLTVKIISAYLVNWNLELR